MLALLVDRAGQVVTRQELQQKVWPTDVHVGFDQGLNNAIKKVRDALGDSALYVLDQQASFQNVIVRIDDVLLINIFEPMNQKAQIRQDFPVICTARFSEYIQGRFQVRQCDLGFTVV